MSAAFDLESVGDGLAFADALGDLSSALDQSPAVVVSAPPGTGKTTLVPPVVANRTAGRVIVTQPRRVAARAAARRLAQLDDSPLGDRIGFTVRGERQVGPQTRIEFVTAGVLLRRLLDDPALDGVDAIIIDEVHERALETDLLIGLLGEVRQLRDDLVLVAMSATLDADRVAAVVGTDAAPAPVVTQTIPQHPLEERWAPSPAPRLDERGVTRAFLDHVAGTAASAGRELARTDPSADVLVFAPERVRSPRSPAASEPAPTTSTSASCTANCPRQTRMPSSAGAVRTRCRASSSPRRWQSPRLPSPASTSWSTPACRDSRSAMPPAE